MIAPSSPSSKSSWPTLLLVLVAATAAVSCQWVFGDFEFQPNDGSGGAGAGGADGNGGVATGGANPNACSPDGARGCDNGQPRACSNGAWENVGSPCSPAGLCNATTGACDVCLKGGKRCGAGNKSIETCRSTSDGWDVTLTCSGTSFCDPNKLTTCVACSLRESHCTGGASLAVCKGDQSGFDTGSCAMACVTLSDKLAQCANCDPLTSTPNCTTAGVLVTCASNGIGLETACPNGCADATSTIAAHCKP